LGNIFACGLLTPDLAPSDYHLFASMGHALAQQLHFLRKWLDDWFGSKEQQFFWRGICLTNCQTGEKNV